MISGTGITSLRKQDLGNQKTPTIGYQKLVFAHKATNGQTGINLASLTTPSELTSQGFTQPSLTQLQGAQMMFYRNNLTLVSSVRGRLIDYLSYTVSTNLQITFQGFTALPGEIFTGTLDFAASDGIQVVDADAIGATGTLAANTTDFNVGTPFTVNKYPSRQFGDVIVYLDGWQQFRNSGNSSTVLDGNYYEVDAGGGLGTIIRFNVTDPNPRSVLVQGNGLVATRPTGSTMAVIEAAQGQLNNMATYVAALAGQPVNTILGGAPSNVDLKAFGDKVFAIDTRLAIVEAKAINATTTQYGFVSPYINTSLVHGASYTPVLTIMSGLASATLVVRNAYYSRNGPMVTVSGLIEYGNATTTGIFEISLPIASNFADASYLADANGMLGVYDGADGWYATCSIRSNPVTDRAAVTLTVTPGGGRRCPFVFTYMVAP